ncbi:MAG: phenylalanine--tRNA ligase subunit alpha [Sulfolobales archaeon]
MYRLNNKQFFIVNTLKEYANRKVTLVDVEELARSMGINAQDIMRDLAELEMKGLIKIHRSIKYLIKLSELGVKYLREGLPESKLLNIVIDLSLRGVRKLRIDELAATSNLESEEFSAALGILKKYGIVSTSRNYVEVLLDEVKVGVFRKYLDDLTSFLKMLTNGLVVERLDDNLMSVRRRGFIDVSEVRDLKVELTNTALNALREGLIITKEVVTVLTPDLISSGGWREVEFKEFDLSVEVPLIHPSRKHPYAEFLNHVREVVVSMGFEEMRGPHVELEFWNFDILYLPQYHPARSTTDVYFIKNVPPPQSVVDAGVLDKVRDVHESGGIANSTGWGCKWDPSKALRLILRTHTTSVSMRTIYERGEGEYRCFSLDRVFRPDTPDPTHLMEFHQLEGIIVGRYVAFKHLLGFFKEFAKRLGLGEVLFKPAYFPFTEPSVEGYVKHPKLGWIEVFPGGMFRPEVLRPLDVVSCNVAAWGIGIDRIAMMVLDVDDIRDLYTNSLDVIRKLRIPKTMLSG